MSKHLGTVRSISYHEEFLDSLGLEMPVRRDEGSVVMEVVFSGLEVLHDIRVGDFIRIGGKD